MNQVKGLYTFKFVFSGVHPSWRISYGGSKVVHHRSNLSMKATGMKENLKSLRMVECNMDELTVEGNDKSRGGPINRREV